MLLVFIVAVANFCLGYALATYFAPGANDNWFGWHFGGGRSPQQEIGVVDSLDDVTNASDLLVEVASTEGEARDGEEPSRAKSALEVGLDDLSTRLDAYRVQLSEADSQLHSAEDEQAVTAILDHLAPSHHQCQQALSAAVKSLAGADAKFRESDGVGTAIGHQIHTYLNQIESVDRGLARVELANDAAPLTSDIREQIGQLLESSFELRDHLTEAQAFVAEQEGRLGSVGRRARADRELTTLSRTGFEEELWLWWQNDPHRQRQLSLLAIDIDHCRRINGAYGAATGDRVLWGLARVLDEEIRGEDRLARFAGQRFVALLPDTGPHSAAALAERLRQRIEACTFQIGELKLNVTVTCGVTESQSKDDISTLLLRLGEAAREAKRNGRNRTYVHDGKIISPVLPPSLRFPARTMAL